MLFLSRNVTVILYSHLGREIRKLLHIGTSISLVTKYPCVYHQSGQYFLKLLYTRIQQERVVLTNSGKLIMSPDDEFAQHELFFSREVGSDVNMPGGGGGGGLRQ